MTVIKWYILWLSINSKLLLPFLCLLLGTSLSYTLPRMLNKGLVLNLQIARWQEDKKQWKKIFKRKQWFWEWEKRTRKTMWLFWFGELWLSIFYCQNWLPCLIVWLWFRDCGFSWAMSTTLPVSNPVDLLLEAKKFLNFV